MTARSMPGPCAVLLLGVYFLMLAWPGVKTGFTHDDLMNLYRAEQLPLWGHVRDIALFFTHSDTYRPAGSLFYRLIYGEVGFRPEAYRAGCHALMTLNLGLCVALARRLSGSGLVALWTGLLWAFHGEMSPLYSSTGFIYDILCFTFTCGAFLFYLWARREGRVPGVGAMAVWSALYVAALDSKEMAVALPVVMLAWEALTNGPGGWRDLPRWLWRDGRVALWGGLLTALYVAGRVCGEGGLSANSGYVPEVTVAAYLDRARMFLWFTAYRADWFTGAWAAGLGAAMAGLSVVWRRVGARMAVVWALVGILPVAFIEQRSLAAVYLPFFGLALFVAEVVEALRRRLPWGEREWQFAVLWLVAGVYFHQFHQRHNPLPAHLAKGEHVQIEQVAGAMAAWRRELRCARRILFVSDPFPQYDWNSFFLVALLANDPYVFTPPCDGARPDVLSPDRVLTMKRLRERYGEGAQVAPGLVLSYEEGAMVRLTAGEWSESQRAE